MNRYLLPLLGLVCWLSAAIAQATLSDPAQIQTEAYVNLVQADQGLDAGRLDEALAQYQVARDYYQQLASDFPGWEPRIVQYRKTYCDNQMADIQRRMNGDAAMNAPELAPLPVRTPPPPPEPVVVARPAPDRAATERSVELDYLKSRVSSLESQLSDMDSVQDDYDTLNEAYSKLVEEQKATRQQLSEKTRSEQAALADLQARLDAKDHQIQSLQRDLDAKKELDQVLNDMEAKVNELREKNKRLQQEIKTLDAELDDAEIRADQALLAAQQAEAKLKDSGDSVKQLKKAKSELKKSEKRVKKLEKSETRLKAAEKQAKSAQKQSRDSEKELKKVRADLADAKNELKQARSDLADAESKLALSKRKPIFDKADRSAQESALPAKSEEKPVAEEKPEPQTEPRENQPAPETEPFMATVPPNEIPSGTSPADYVRQLLQEGENDAALATVQQARRSQPADVNLILIEGIALIRLQRYEEAATMMIDLAKNNPRNAEVHATLGAAMMGAGFYDEARETLLMAMKLDKNLPECQYNLAQLYAFIDPISIKKARRYYKQALDLGLPPDPSLEKALK